MTENRARFALLCQQALAGAVVLAVAVPATGVATLDIVAPGPGQPPPTGAPARVAAEPVMPTVRSIPLRSVASLRSSQGGLSLAAAQPEGQTSGVSDPEPVTGYATVGVTWAGGEDFADDEISVQVRTLADGSWSAWQQVNYDATHGPDPDSPEGRQARDGTDAVVVGDVDDVQVRVSTEEAELPADLRLEVVDPGETTATVAEGPAIDTARPPAVAAEQVELRSAQPSEPAEPTEPAPDAELIGTPAEVTPQPQIFSRAQWGADERLRDKDSLRYFEVHAGFVHHTVNANGYTRDQVPAIIRGIYAYHTRSRGWSDIGYNFLVDRFGRIWEGRYGGVDRPVVGAHTLGYNEYSFAMSAIGNFETARPGAAMLDAYGALFAWKLSLHGVAAGDPAQKVGGKTFPAVNGHRDADSTACPGRYLYAKLDAIRSRAVAAQAPFTSRARDTDLSGSRWPDLVVRDPVTKQAHVVRTGGQIAFTSPTVAAAWSAKDLVVAVRDVTGDRVADVLARDRVTGRAAVHPGDGSGGFGAAVAETGRFRAVDQLTGVGDLDGDGRADVVGRRADTGRLLLYPGKGGGAFGWGVRLAEDWRGYRETTGVGDLDGDGRADLVARDGADRLWLVPGTGAGIGTPVALPGTWAGFDVVTGLGDLTGDRVPDLVARVRRTQAAWIYPGDGAGGLAQRLGPFRDFAGLDLLQVAGQLVGNRAPDLLGRDGAGRLVVVGNTGRRNLHGVRPTDMVLGNTDRVLSVGDWNGDGHGDVVTRRASDGALLLRLGEGRNRFADPVVLATGFGSVRLLAAVGDMTGDGFPDLMGQPEGGSMRIYPGNGGRGLRPGYAAYFSLSGTDQVGPGLFDADGAPDSLVRRSDGTLTLYRGNGPGGLTGGGSQVADRTGRYDWLLGAGDVDGDGDGDLLARERTTGKLWLLPRSGAGFGARRFVAEGFAGYDLAG